MVALANSSEEELVEINAPVLFARGHLPAEGSGSKVPLGAHMEKQPLLHWL